jgi:hypothetical protein
MSFSDRDVKTKLGIILESMRRMDKSGDGSFCGHMIQNDSGLQRTTVWGNIHKLVESGAITQLFMPSNCKDTDKKHRFYRLLKPGQDAHKIDGTKAFAAAMAAKEKDNAITVEEQLSSIQPELTYTANQPSPISIEIPKNSDKTIQIIININVGK